MMDAEQLVEAGQMLISLGRYHQRTFPPPNTVGCQYDEWPILEKHLLPKFGNKGQYIDIGANHPTCCSNTFQLYKMGWSGLLIEPLPQTWPSLLIDRRRDRLCPVACSNRDGFATLRACRSISSLKHDWPVDGEETMPVQTARLSTILDMYAHEFNWSQISLVSVDVEGSEKEVLEGWPFDRLRPELIVIEYIDPHGNDMSGPWKGKLSENGYATIYSGRLNQIWKRQ